MLPAHGEGSDTAPRPQLNATVKPSRTQRLISLSRKEPAPGARCSLAGWGVREDGERSPTLQEMEVTVMDVQRCNSSRFWKGEIGPAMICFQGLRRGSAPAKVRVWGAKRGAEDAPPEQVRCWGSLSPARDPLPGVTPPLRVTRGAPWCAGSGRRWPA